MATHDTYHVCTRLSKGHRLLRLSTAPGRSRAFPKLGSEEKQNPTDKQSPISSANQAFATALGYAGAGMEGQP